MFSASASNMFSADDAVKMLRHSTVLNWKWVMTAIFFSPWLEISRCTRLLQQTPFPWKTMIIPATLARLNVFWGVGVGIKVLLSWWCNKSSFKNKYLVLRVRKNCTWKWWMSVCKMRCSSMYCTHGYQCMNIQKKMIKRCRFLLICNDQCESKKKNVYIYIYWLVKRIK